MSERLPIPGIVWITTPEWEGYFTADEYVCHNGVYDFYCDGRHVRRFWGVRHFMAAHALTTSGDVPKSRYLQEVVT